MAPIPEALAIAIQHHQAGRLQAAEQIYRQILAAEPNQADAIHLLGVVASQAGRLDDAVACYRRALDLKPDSAEVYNNLGIAFREQGKLDDAVACCRRALELKPDYAAAHNNLGVVFTEQGKLDAAVACCRRALELKPDCAEAHNNLGIVLKEQGKLGDAVPCYRRALELQPGYAEAHNNLGVAFKQQGKLDDAIACWRLALELKPDHVEAHYNLGIAFTDQGKLDEAVACYRRALALKPDCAEAHSNLGVAFQQQGKLDEAIACWRRALELKPDFAEVHNNLGNGLKDRGELDEAVACYRRALQLKPDYAEAHYNLGIAFKDQGKLDDALACYRRTLALKPDHAGAHNNLGAAFREQGKLDEALACYRRALELKPDYAKAHNNLGAAFKDQGKLEEAVACYRRALELEPDYAKAHSNLVYTRIFCPGYDARMLYEEHCRWNLHHAEPLAQFIQPHLNDPSPDRRLRVGYVSPDFRNHCQALFTVPLFSAHDHKNFEIVCYADVVRPDSITERLCCCVDIWRRVYGLNDAQVAQLIRQDGIDILVDLTMHMARNRLLVFARKPAPVQACWLAYPGTTGLTAIDYRVTDPYLDPPECNDHHHYSEQSIRLPDAFWCYDPLSSEPAVGPLPALEKGHVTFGCLNNFCKINSPVLKLWAGVLRAIERSQIMILAPEGTHRRDALALLEQEGITPDRVTFVAKRPRPQYLELYHRIDMGLDTFPYNGHTTSLDSFWMGVPVVTLAGRTAVGRAGLSQLTNLGLPELIADSPERFVMIAVELAGDLARLSKLRATLRERLRHSPLMDAPRFARNVEAAYRVMWQRWCAR
jgi:predicted O-linked N-acetylglucosamine transferase (SPINDLY family)